MGITFIFYIFCILCLIIRWLKTKARPQHDDLHEYNPSRYATVFNGLQTRYSSEPDNEFTIESVRDGILQRSNVKYQLTDQNKQLQLLGPYPWNTLPPPTRVNHFTKETTSREREGEKEKFQLSKLEEKVIERVFDDGMEGHSSSIGDWPGDDSDEDIGLSKPRLDECTSGSLRRLDMKIRIYCEKWSSVSYPKGRIMQSTYVFLCTVNWIIYIIGTYALFYVEIQDGYAESRVGRPPLVIEGLCLTTCMRCLNWLNLICHIFFFVYFIIRLGASIDRLLFFFNITSLIDIITISGAVLRIFNPRYHIDFGFLRALNIFNFGEVLSYVGVLSSNNIIQTVDIFFTMFAMWMVASGLIHLIIHIGDFWKENHKSKDWNYLDCAYFLLVTMSTVGYGDYSPGTDLGKVYICFFIPVAMGICAVFVTELIKQVKTRKVKTGTYTALIGHRHVVLCGNFNKTSLNMVLKGFFHSEHISRRHRTNMVILRVLPLDLATKAMLTKYNAWVKYFEGTPNDPQDLARISFRSAQGALVLATPNSSDSNNEDGTNIMQAIALKAHSQRIRVLVQLHHFNNKCLLNNFPRWTYQNNDMVICMDELKLGLLAYNCLAPGFSTMILNLLSGHRMKAWNEKTRGERWRLEYEYGVSMEIYDVDLSYEFNDLGAQELALFAYEKWSIVLLALSCTESDKTNVILNPACHPKLVINTSTMKAIVMATNSIVVNYMQSFCTTCKAHETGIKCECPQRLESLIRAFGTKKSTKISRRIIENWNTYNSRGSDSDEIDPTPVQSDEEDTHLFTRNSHLNVPQASSGGDLTPFFTDPPSVDAMPSSGLDSPRKDGSLRFLDHGFRSQSLRSKRVSSPSHDYYTLRNQPYAPKYVDSTGSFHWVPDVPMSRVKLTLAEASRFNFKDHYLLCLVGPVAGGALNLKSFVYPLRFHWMNVRDIVILGDTSCITESEWIKIKNLPRVFIVQGSPCSLNDLSAVHLMECASCTVLGELVTDRGNDFCLRDKNTLFCAMTIQSLIEESHRRIQMTTEIHHEQNAHHFSSTSSHRTDFKLPLRFQESFARGIIFSNTLLYSSISSLYFSGAVFPFLRTLFFGNFCEDLESVSCLRNGLQRGSKGTTKLAGVRVCLGRMNEAPFLSLFSKKRHQLRYKDLFIRTLMCWRILCLGIYRLDKGGFRVVYTNPPKDLPIDSSDQVFCFIPCHYGQSIRTDLLNDMEEWVNGTPHSSGSGATTAQQQSRKHSTNVPASADCTHPKHSETTL